MANYQPPPPQYYQQPGPYQPAPQYYQPPPQQQQTSNVVVVNNTQPQRTVTYIERDESPNHCLHCIITFFCPWWIIVWCCLCCIYGC